MTRELTIGYLPLVDACLPILAQEYGFAEEEGLHLRFQRDVTWATVLDRLLYGHTDAAHLLAPLAIATALGRGRPAQNIAAPFVLGLNGNAITVTPALARQLGVQDALGDPRELGAALAHHAKIRRSEGKMLRFGVVHRYSSHSLMLRYWLAGCGIQPDREVEIVTIPPPFAGEALEQGEIDGTCVGEPWNSVAVERGVGQIILATSQIWRRGVEKVLAMRESVMEAKREETEALIRAMRKAGARFIDPAHFEDSARILASETYLDCDPALVMRAISDRLLLRPGTEPVHFPDFMFQYAEAANFPWVSQAQWIYTQMVRWDGGTINREEADRASRVFRPDIYRSALSGTGDTLPGASSKVEGSLRAKTPVSTQQGSITLDYNQFFDERVFDPEHLEAYLAQLP